MSSTDNSAHDHVASDEHVDNTLACTLRATTASDTTISPIPIRAAHRAPFLQGPPWRRQWEAEQRQLYPTPSLDLTHISNIPSPDAPVVDRNAADASASVDVPYEENATRALCTSESSALHSAPTTPDTAVASTSASPTPASPKAIDASQSNSPSRSSESPELQGLSPVSAALRVPYNPHDALFAPVEPYDVHTSLSGASYTAPHNEESWKALVEINRAIMKGDIPRYTPSPPPNASDNQENWKAHEKINSPIEAGAVPRYTPSPTSISAWNRAPSPVQSQFFDEGDSDKENYDLEVQRMFDPYTETWTTVHHRVLSPVLTYSSGPDYYSEAFKDEHTSLCSLEEVGQKAFLPARPAWGERPSPSPAGFDDLSTRGTTSSSPEPALSRVYEMKIYTPEDAHQIYAEYEAKKRGRSADSDDDDDEDSRAVKRRRSASPSASTTHHEFNEYDIESSDSSDDEFVGCHE